MSSSSSQTVLPRLFPDVKLVSIYNFKGGVGKTTTAHNLSDMMAEDGKKVLLLDIDAQCNLTSILNSNVLRIEEQLQAEEDREDDFEFEESIVMEPKENLLKLWIRYINDEHLVETGDGNLNNQIETLIQVDRTKNPIFVPGTHSIYDIEQWHNTRKDELRERFKLVTMILNYTAKLGCDYVIADLNPGDSLLNRTILYRSDFIVTPTFLDHSSISSTFIFRNKILASLEATGITATQRYSSNSRDRKGTVVITKYKVRDGAVVKLHRKWKNLLVRLCREYPCKLLCPAIETGAFSRINERQTSLVRITNAGTEQWKIETYRSCLSQLLGEIYAVTH